MMNHLNKKYFNSIIRINKYNQLCLYNHTKSILNFRLEDIVFESGLYRVSPPSNNNNNNNDHSLFKAITAFIVISSLGDDNYSKKFKK